MIPFCPGFIFDNETIIGSDGCWQRLILYLLLLVGLFREIISEFHIANLRMALIQFGVAGVSYPQFGHRTREQPFFSGHDAQA